jgi:RNA polymerase sigma-70 factor, ECF subfamily
MTVINDLTAPQVIAPPSPNDNQSATATVDTAILVQMLKSKSERGFHILYDKYCGALYSILIKIVRRTDVADDLLQDVFLKIWKHIDGFDPARGTLFTWMLNIARNQAIDYLRSSGYQQQMQQVNVDFSSLHLDFRRTGI